MKQPGGRKVQLARAESAKAFAGCGVFTFCLASAIARRPSEMAVLIAIGSLVFMILALAYWALACFRK